jgi:hypothetical protein
MATEDQVDVWGYEDKLTELLEQSGQKELFWYWKKKAKYVKKFTGLDIIRIYSFHVDPSDREFVNKFLGFDYNLRTLYGDIENQQAYDQTTWGLLSLTLSYVGDLWADIYAFKSLMPMQYSWPTHVTRFKYLYNAWLAHYMRMHNKDDTDIDLNETYPYPEPLAEDPWWYL